MRVAGSSVRLDERDLAREDLAGERLDGRLDRLPDPDQADLVLVDLGLDPDVRRSATSNIASPSATYWPSTTFFLTTTPADRGEDRHPVKSALPVREDLVDLLLGDPPELELLGRQADQLLAVARGATGPGRSAAAGASLARSLGQEQLLDRLVELGAVELGQGLARLDGLPVKLT